MPRRQTDEMPATARHDPAHADHDLALIAALADRAADARTATPEASAAARLVATCDACAALHADLLALTVGLRTASTPRRTRDFRLTPEDVARLQPRGWRRFLATIGSARDGVTRPLAVGLTTLGLVGVLVGTVPAVLPLSGATGGAGMTAQEDMKSSEAPALVPSAQGPAAAPGASPEAGAMTAGPDTAGNEGEAFTDGSGAAPSGGTGELDQNRTLSPEELSLRDDATGMSVLIVVGGTLFILGIGLFALRWTARRFG